MRGLRAEVVMRPIHVNWQQEDRIEAVLLAVPLRLDKHHLLGEAVRRIRLLWVTSPKVVLLERYRSVHRIRADAPQGYKLWNFPKVGLMHELSAHHQVFIKKLPWMLTVYPDAADFRCQMQHDLGVGIIFVHPLDIL